MSGRCFLAHHGVMEHDDPMPACDGRIVKVHLIPRRVMKGYAARIMLERGISEWDVRSWVPGCGGPMGNAGHHGMLDFSRTLRLPREAIPARVEELAEELGLAWWLDREYGERGVRLAAHLSGVQA